MTRSGVLKGNPIASLIFFLLLAPLPAKEYSLEEVIQLSLANNELVNSKILKMESFEWEKKANASPMNPSVTVSAGAKNVKDEPGVAYSGNGIAYTPGRYIYGSMPSLTVSQPVRFPSKKPLQNEILENQRKMAGLDIEETKLMIRFDVIRLSYQISATEEKLHHAFEEKAKLKLIKDYLSTRPVVSPRMRLDADIVNNKYLLINKRIHELQSEKDSRWNELNFYLGMNDRPEIKTDWFVEGIDIDENEIAAKLEKQNLNYKKRMLAMNVIQKNIKLARVAAYPDLDVFVQMSQENADTRENHYNFGVAFPLPVFNGGLNKSRSFELKFDSAKKENMYYMAKLQSRLHQAVEEYHMQRKIIIELPYKSFHKMHGTLNYAEIEFKKGRISVAEFVNFLEKAHDAHTEIIDTQMAFLAKYIAILNIMYEQEFIVR